MKLFNVLPLLMLTMVTSQTWAYGSSSSQKACQKPVFSDFDPADKAEVAPGAPFSFLASGVSDPSSISVTVKGQPVEVAVKELPSKRYAVTGNLPETLKGDYARITISAQGKCKGSDGWLVKITE
jgi:hypothetical protein